MVIMTRIIIILLLLKCAQNVEKSTYARIAVDQMLILSGRWLVSENTEIY